jgi:hypothetical protein
MADIHRADVELTIQIGMETDAEAIAVLGREAKRVAKKALLDSDGKVEHVLEEQWCSGAMRVIVRRPLLAMERIAARRQELIDAGHCMEIDTLCTWEGCPQVRDGEPKKTGRSCPRWVEMRKKLDPDDEGRAGDQG